MPHATSVSEPFTGHSKKVAKASSNNKQLRQVQAQYDQSKALFDQSSLSASVDATLRGKLSGRTTPVTKVVSLGLGSFTERSKDQARRFKQLAMFTAIINFVNMIQPATSSQLELYAQDPSFTRTDILFLNNLGIKVLKTPSPSELGEAQRIVDHDTLVYSPFLTIEAYKMLLAACRVDLLIGDDFSALKNKWDKNTDEYRDVELMIKAHISHLKRRAVSGTGFWEDEDKPFPMALYWRPDTEVPRARL